MCVCASVWDKGDDAALQVTERNGKNNILHQAGHAGEIAHDC